MTHNLPPFSSPRSPLGSQFSKELLNNATVAEVAKQAGKTPAQVG